jgi:hypothetical protein
MPVMLCWSNSRRLVLIRQVTLRLNGNICSLRTSQEPIKLRYIGCDVPTAAIVLWDVTQFDRWEESRHQAPLELGPLLVCSDSI